MPRLSIDITSDEHQKLKAIAALKGQSIKDYVLSQTLSKTPMVDDMSDDEALSTLSEFLEERMKQVERDQYSVKSFEDIRSAAKKRAGL